MEQNLTPTYSANPPFNAGNQITVFWLGPTITITSVDYNNVNSAAVENALFAGKLMELGHDLGLVHCPTDCGGNPNLMDASGYGSTTLTGAQATTILASGLVQNNVRFGNFIDLQAITFTPEPGTLVLLGSAGVLLLAVQRRRSARG